MRKIRRGFVWELTAMAGLLAICDGVAMGQRSGRPPLSKRPPPEGPHEKDKIAETSDQDAAKRAADSRKRTSFVPEWSGCISCPVNYVERAVRAEVQEDRGDRETGEEAEETGKRKLARLVGIPSTQEA